ncbi:hypothetical protein A3D42_00940 [Candidatus Nomurabacteria bacterium RIFCSPHIGHO2_02_FULL_41_18]|uniref:Uncharacterized protein n=1 Tax=Candidatus Nomurabacteria bacterium RIFCSPHIGHO2_02_FULL_41_18 TaxID=1801754 RepID=A0A1F6W5A2_9BACT|nr:MAG: hypothetical protein A2737_00860 [Candidatus Nomurabacteria bacterium RIFCSPHIGHO2_01_FULL_41_71]OGI77071.1 MAG: hypothetical protein A3D42_00940 [Candidatus Nomurabacteria bacterium RIFCSPHIGHO2_02_FULL_41_18]OGI90125.1 MAG: hypothetical protein A3B01_02385 [Candidatus Nomurabacteria bacterium RIFCSPLOWO2_01_FULL_41_52b]OGJ00542.1 MAG: hypothetical protein A3I90_00410 [Candidatus Nomurabacteria bacterium RIFCSPLOWO2_02_FULL_41_9]
MPRKSPKNEHKEIKIEAYSHAGKKRKNNPPVGLVSSQTDKLNGTRFTNGKWTKLTFPVLLMLGPH